MVRDVVTHLAFGRDVAYNATGMTDVDYGELIAIDENGSILNAGALSAYADDKAFYLVVGKGNGNSAHWVSPRITKKNIVAHRGSSYAADTQQVSYIGYNTTTGAINAENSTEYSVVVSFGYDKDLYSLRRDVKRFNYTSDASATQDEIAQALVDLMNADEDFARQAVAAKTSSGSDRGISITGKALTDVDTDIDNPILVHFKVTLELGFDATTGVDEFGYLYVNGAAPTTSSAASVAPKPGVGTPDKMKALERNNKGFNSGHTNLRKFPVISDNSLVSATGTYDIYVLDIVDEHLTQDVAMGASRKSPMQIVIANDISTTVNGTTTEIEALLFAASGVSVNL